jgi:hypothetical protein
MDAVALETDARVGVSDAMGVAGPVRRPFGLSQVNDA